MAYNEYLTYKEQVTYDGINWVDTGVVVPSGDPIGTYDTLEECELGTKVRIGYGTRVGYIDTYKSKACDGDNVLHRSEVKIPNNRFGALYIGDCVEIIESGLTRGFVYDYNIDFYRIDGGTNVRTIGQDAFSGQTRLFVRGLNIKMPNLKRIEKNAFRNIGGQADDNYGASGFTLPDGLEYIGDYAFYGGGGSTQGGYFTIPASVTFIGDKALATNVNYNGYEFKGTVPPAINGNPFKGYFSSGVYVPADRSVIQAYLDAFTMFDQTWSAIQPTPNGPVFRTLDCKVGIYPSPRGLGQFKYIWKSTYNSVLNASDVRCLDGNCNLQLAGLTEVIVGNKCSTISAETFVGRTELSSVTIADTVTEIGMGAFIYCTSLSNVSLPDTLTGMTSYLFSGCTSLTSIGLKGSGASIEIPDSVTSIGPSVFADCTGLTSVVIPSGVTYMGGYDFMGCTSLTSVTLPDTLNMPDTFLSGLFSGCTSLASVVVPSVKYIGDYFFADCTSLTSVVIPSGVAGIGRYAFTGCTSLTSVTLPETLGGIGYHTFSGCTNLTSVTILATTPPELGEAVFYDTNDCPIYVPASSVEAYKAATDWRGYRSRIQAIPTKWIATYSDSSVTSAECGSSSEIVQNEINTTNLVSLEIGDCVTSIGDYAFTSCSGLTSCTIGSDVTSIGEMAFRNCNSLTSISIPNSVTRISYGAFIYCTSLTSIDIPSGVTSIGSKAFQYCSGLTSVTVEATTPPTLGGTSVFADTNNCPIYVPASSVDAYKTATNWSTYADRIQAIT